MIIFFAVREGFEPSVRLPVRQLGIAFKKKIRFSDKLLTIKNDYFWNQLKLNTLNTNIKKRTAGKRKNYGLYFVVYPYMIDTHKHILKYSPDISDILERNITIV